MADVKALKGVPRMAIILPKYSPRLFVMLTAAACAAVALFLFAPWGAGLGPWGVGAQLPPSLEVAGTVQVQVHDNVVTRLVVPLGVRGNEGIPLTDDSGAVRAETDMSPSAAAAVPATYTLTWPRGHTGNVLSPGETATLTVDLPAHSSVHPGNPLRLVLHTANGGSLTIENVLGTTG